MSAILAAFLLLAQATPQEEKKPPQEEKKPQDTPVPQEPVPAPEPPPAEEPWLLDLQADVRMGGWRTPTFDAVTPAGRRRIDGTLLFEVGFDVRAIYSGWSLTFTGDHAAGKSLSLEMGGLLLGAEWAVSPEPLPLDVQIAAGPILGRLDVDVAGFGSFKTALGVEIRAAATSWLHERVGLSLWIDYRQISFKYDEPVTSGDKSAGGASFALGAGLVMRF